MAFDTEKELTYTESVECQAKASYLATYCGHFPRLKKYVPLFREIESKASSLARKKGQSAGKDMQTVGREFRQLRLEIVNYLLAASEDARDSLQKQIEKDVWESCVRVELVSPKTLDNIM